MDGLCVCVHNEIKSYNFVDITKCSELYRAICHKIVDTRLAEHVIV